MPVDTTHLAHIPNVTLKLARLQSQLNAQAIRLLRQNSDVSLTEWRALSFVVALDGTTLSELVRDTGLDKGQLSRGVSSLVSKSYIKSVVNDGDQRQNFLHTTPNGRELFERLQPIMVDRQTRLTDGIEQKDLEAFWRVVDHMNRASAPNN